MNIDDIFASKYLKAVDLLGRTFKLTIAAVTVETFKEQGRDKMKPVVFFTGKQKGLMLNKTNSLVIAAAYGKNTDAWIGRAIEVYPDSTFYQGSPTPCIRVRAFNPAPMVTPAPVAVPPPAIIQPETYDDLNDDPNFGDPPF